MKGANLVKYERRPVQELDREESPDRQNDLKIIEHHASDDLVHQDTQQTSEEVKQPEAIQVQSMTQSKESLRPDTFTKTGPATPVNFETMRQENNLTEVPQTAVNEPQSNVTAV